MKQVLALALLTVSFSGHAGYLSASCKNEATGAVVNVLSYVGSNLGTFKFNSSLVKNLYNQGVSFVQDQSVGSVNWSGDRYSFVSDDGYGDKVSLEVQDSGTLLTYFFRNKNLTANFFFNPGECSFLKVDQVKH